MKNSRLNNYSEKLFCQAIKKIVLTFTLIKTVFLLFFVLVYTKWLIVNIVQTSISLQKLVWEQ